MNITAILTSHPITIPPIPGVNSTVITQINTALSNPAVAKNITNEVIGNTFSGAANYFSFMSVGMVSFIVLFTCMFSGMSIVWDRRLGILNKLLSTPVARGSILMSKVLNSVIRSLMQAAIVLGIAFALGLTPGPDFSPVYLLGVFAAVFLLCMGLSSIFILIAIRSTNWQTQMAVMNLLNLPLLFASNALFPTSIMPSWLKDVANVNPVSYATTASRILILDPLTAKNIQTLAMDFGVLGVFAVVFSTIGIVLSWRYLSR
jgi:ABC-2 type transport system permease protein